MPRVYQDLWHHIKPFIPVQDICRVRTLSRECAAMWSERDIDQTVCREFHLRRIRRYPGSLSLHFSRTHVVSIPLRGTGGHLGHILRLLSAP